MRSYNPEKNKGADPKEVIKDFFENDLYEPDSFFVFRRELIDYFSVNKEARSTYRPYWLLSVYAYWHFLSRISPEEAVNNLVEQIPDAVRLGFNVSREFISYLREKFFVEEEMRTFYSKIREQIMMSDVSVGAKGEGVKFADLYKELKLLNSYSDDTMKAAEFYDRLQRVLFAGAEEDPINEYIIVDPSEATTQFVGLINFILNTEPKFIWVASEAEIFRMTTGLDPSSVEAPVGAPPLDLEAVLELPAIKAVPAPELPPELKNQELIMDPDVRAEDLYKISGVPLPNVATVSQKSEPVEKTVKREAPVAVNTAEKTATRPAFAPAAPVAPSYAEIRGKIDAAFEKDAEGNYEDLDLVVGSLQKAAEKYNDPKIAELYYFDESTGNFKWNV